MMDNKLLILYPRDATTSFLNPILYHLFNHADERFIYLLTSSSNRDLRTELSKQIQEIDCNTVIYLGHGSSKSLGSIEQLESSDVFFLNANELSIFSNKNFICLSCNSNELLRKNYKDFNIEAIGFGDLPTGWPDITSVRQYNQDAYKGITDEIINEFNDSIVDIMKFSVTDYLNKKLSMNEVFNLLTLRINKKISTLYKSDSQKNMILNDIFLTMKQEMKYFTS